MDRLPNDTFIWLHTLNPRSDVIKDVVGIVTDEGVYHLWADKAWLDGRQLITQDISIWTDENKGVVIDHDHPDYDKWWAWWTAVQLGVRIPPPIESKE